MTDVGSESPGSPGRLAYFEWSAEVVVTEDDAAAGAARADRGRVAEANPAYGIRITDEAIDTELEALEGEDFDRERLGIFADQLDAVEPVIPEESWATCERKSSKLLDPVVLAFEVSVDRRWGVIAAAGPSSLDGWHVEVVEHRRFTGWMVARLIELVEKHHPVSVVVNPAGPAGALLEDCRKAKLELVEAGGRDVVQACGAAYDDVIEGRWSHIGQSVLTLSVNESAKRVVGDAWVFDRRGSADISPLAAVTLAAWGARKAAEESVYDEDRGLIIL